MAGDAKVKSAGHFKLRCAAVCTVLLYALLLDFNFGFPESRMRTLGALVTALASAWALQPARVVGVVGVHRPPSMSLPAAPRPAIVPPGRAAAAAIRLAATDSETVVDANYKLAASLVAIGGVVLVAPWLVGGFILLLGVFLTVQTLRIRFVFDEDSFEVPAPPHPPLPHPALPHLSPPSPTLPHLTPPCPT